MPLPREQVYTTDDIYALPDGERAELIDGQYVLVNYTALFSTRNILKRLEGEK